MATTKATNLGHRSDVTLKGTTTTVDSNVVVSDTTTINNAGDDVGLKINSESTGHIMQLQDSGTDVMVVKDGGNIGIGTNSPANILEVKDDNSLMIGLNHTSGAAPNNFYIGQDSTGNLRFTTNSAVKAYVKANGDVEVVDGNLVIGTGGKGIDFSNQTSSTGTDATLISPDGELLDHYEWGTYRVILTPDSGSFTMDTGRDLLGFVKVGNICTISGYARVISSSTPSGLITFNLPFAASSMNEYANKFVGHAVPENMGNSPPSYYTSNDFHCFINSAGATTAEIKRTSGGTAASNWGGVADYFSTNTNVTISITYITA